MRPSDNKLWLARSPLESRVDEVSNIFADILAKARNVCSADGVPGLDERDESDLVSEEIY